MESLPIWLVLLPVAPIVAVVIGYPASGVLSDSLASSGSALWPILVVLCYIAAAFLEFWIRDRLEGLVVSVPLGLTALSTIEQALLVDGGVCNTWCVLHSVALVVYVLAELVGLHSRGVSTQTLLPFAVALTVTAAVYRAIVGADDFDASHGPTQSFLYYVGTLQVCAFVAARVFVAMAAV